MVEGNSLAPGSRHKISYMWLVQGGLGMVGADQSWNNGKEVPRLDLTSLTMPGQQIRVIGCRVAVPHSHWSAVPTLLFIYISQLLRDSFFVSQQPPIWEPPSHYSMWLVQTLATVLWPQVGMALNSFVLYVFYNDRQHLNTSVNTMTRSGQLTDSRISVQRLLKR